MQLKSLYFAAALLAVVTFPIGRADAQAVRAEPGVVTVAGTVAELRVQTRELVITTEDGNTLPVKVSGNTEFLRVPPGVHDLRQATAASPHEIKVGDHVLASYGDGMTEARRVVFMPAAIAGGNQSESSDWESRGLSGTVSGKTSNGITAQLPGYAKFTILVTPKTAVRRYAPDAVTLGQATPSSMASISSGDQIRARGEKSSDGQTVTADEVVFGTFLTKGGTITAIDANGHEIAIQEVGTKKPLTVRIAAESKLKMLPSMQMPDGSETSSHESVPDHVPVAPGGAVDIAKLLSEMPDCKIGDLKIGDAILVSSTKGSSENEVTAITVLANAEMFVQLMQQQAEGNTVNMERFLRGHGWDPAQGLTLPAIPR